MRPLRSALAALVLLGATAFAAEPVKPTTVATAPLFPSWLPQEMKRVKIDPAVLNAVPAKGPDGRLILPVTPPAAGQCQLMDKPRPGPHPFIAGEELVYDIDVLGVRAGKMTLGVHPESKGPRTEIPVRVLAESNQFFNKIRRVKAEATSYLDARTLHPHRFVEDSIEGDYVRHTNVSFLEKEKVVDVDWKTNTAAGEEKYAYSNDGLDYVGGIFLFRALPLKVGEPFCFETYAMKRLWRVEGKVEAKEHVSTPAGEFDTFHVSASARRMSGAPMQRDVHVWISDDARRLPVACLGVIDLGPVRATLSSFSRPDAKTASAGPNTMNW